VDALGLLRRSVAGARFFFLSFSSGEKCLVEIDLGEFVIRSEQNKCVWIIGI